MTYAETRTGLSVHIVHPRHRTEYGCGGAVHRVLPNDAPIRSDCICPSCLKFQEINK